MLGDANDEGQIEFTLEVGGARRTRGFDLANVQGLVFMRTPAADAPSPLCKVVDLNQNTFVAAKLQLGGEVMKAEVSKVEGSASSGGSGVAKLKLGIDVLKSDGGAAAGMLRVVTVSGATFKVSRSSVVRLDFTNDKISYLSDMTPYFANLPLAGPAGNRPAPAGMTNLDGKRAAPGERRGFFRRGWPSMPTPS